MKQLLIIVLFCPLLSTAQMLPRFVNDTLYTTSGYTIYKGQVLHPGSGTSDAGYFKFIKFHPSMGKNNTYILKGSSILVNKLKNYKNSGSDENTIRIMGTASYTDGRKEEVDIIMNFERAIENFGGQAAELIVPEEYTSKRSEPVTPAVKRSAPVEKTNVPDDLRKILVADEIKKLFDLYKSGAITKDEYELQKKKLLERQ